MVDEVDTEISDDGEVIGRNRDALKMRLDWLVDQTWRAYEDGDTGRAVEFGEHCDAVARAADAAASALNDGVFAHTAFCLVRDEAQEASSQFAFVNGAEPEAASGYMYAGWEQCKKAFGSLYGI
jgi:hypothetical protein